MERERAVVSEGERQGGGGGHTAHSTRKSGRNTGCVVGEINVRTCSMVSVIVVDGDVGICVWGRGV